MSIRYRVEGGTAREIAESLEASIRAGAPAAGELLPSVRALAADLGVATGTVAAAYRALRDRGIVETAGRNGTSVRHRQPLAARSAPAPLLTGVVDLGSGQPDPRVLPALRPQAWAHWSGPASAPEGLVLPAFIEVATGRLADAGVPTDAVTLASGGLDAMSRLLTARLRAGDAVAVEDPGWPNLLDLVAALGLRALPLAVDGRGPHPEALRSVLAGGARAVIVTSRAQNPTGAFLDAERAGELRSVFADGADTFLIEDDHAAELAGVPLETLSGATSAWAFVRSLSKPWGPDLRISVIAGDEATVSRVESRLRIGSGWVSTLLQRTALHLWTDDAAAGTVEQAARSYDARRTALVDALAAAGVGATGDTGLNVWIPLQDETSAVAALLASGWAVAPGHRFRQVSPPAIRVTVSALDERSIPRLAADVARAIGGAPSAAPTT